MLTRSSCAVLLLAVALTACRDSATGNRPFRPPSTDVLDADRDGVAADVDCDDHDATAYRDRIVFTDADGDGIGVGTPQSRCIGELPPHGLALLLGDCDDADPYLADSLEFAATDLDRDGHFARSAGMVCTNGVLPPEYRAEASASHRDCDDSDYSKWRVVVVYQDIDGDGVGSGAGDPVCIGEGPPVGHSLLGFDPLDSSSDPDSRSVSDFDLPVPRLTTPESVEDERRSLFF